MGRASMVGGGGSPMCWLMPFTAACRRYDACIAAWYTSTAQCKGRHETGRRVERAPDARCGLLCVTCDGKEMSTTVNCCSHLDEHNISQEMSKDITAACQ
jgi:hypothetical protein